MVVMSRHLLPECIVRSVLDKLEIELTLAARRRTLTTAVPTLPSPAPKKSRKVSAAAIRVADERKMTFLRSPRYLHGSAPPQSVS